MSRRMGLSRREVLVGGGLAYCLGAHLLAIGREARAKAADSVPAGVKRLNWSDLRPKAAAAAALRERIEARRRGELGLPPELGAETGSGFGGAGLGGAGLGGEGLSSARGDKNPLAMDWVAGDAIDGGPAADAPFSWGPATPARLEDLVGSLDGLEVALPGYAVPLDLDEGGARSFLLAPYVGACIHVPPPPANQIVLVSTQEPYVFGGMFEPVLVVGRMRVGPASATLAEAGYQIKASAIRPFDAEKEGAEWRRARD